MRTLSSSPCQLRLGVVLRHLSLSSYMIGDLIRNIRNNWKETRDIGREYNRRKKEHWK